MKKIFTLLMMVPGLLLATGCSSDDPVNLAAEITGNYEGYAEASCMYFSGDFSAEQKISVTSGTAPDKVNISYVSTTWGSVAVADALVSEGTAGYVVSGTGKWTMGMGGNSSDYDCTVSGVVKEGATEFTFTSPAVMGGLTVAFTEGELPAAKVVPGSYKGWTDASCAYFQGTLSDNQTVTITENNGTYSVAYESDTWGSFSFSDVSVEYGGGVFAISGSGSCSMGHAGSVKDYPCTMTGSVDPGKSAPTFKFEVPAVMGGLTITFNTGEMPAE